MAKSSPAGANVIRDLQIEAALKQARALHQAGKIGAAGALCQRILGIDPRHADALHLLGVMALQTDSFDIAIASLTRALAIRPRSPAILLDLGQALAAAGKPASSAHSFTAHARGAVSAGKPPATIWSQCSG